MYGVKISIIESVVSPSSKIIINKQNINKTRAVTVVLCCREGNKFPGLLETFLLREDRGGGLWRDGNDPMQRPHTSCLPSHASHDSGCLSSFLFCVSSWRETRHQAPWRGRAVVRIGLP